MVEGQTANTKSKSDFEKQPPVPHTGHQHSALVALAERSLIIDAFRFLSRGINTLGTGHRTSMTEIGEKVYYPPSQLV